MVDQNEINSRDYYYTPESFGFTPFNKNYSKIVRNAITDSLKLNSSMIAVSDASNIRSIKTLELSDNLLVDIHYTFHIIDNEYLDAIVDTLIFKEPKAMIDNKTVRNIQNVDYNKILDHIILSRKNLFGLIERVSAPHISLCKNAECTTHLKSKKEISEATGKDAEMVNRGLKLKVILF